MPSPDLFIIVVSFQMINPLRRSSICKEVESVERIYVKIPQVFVNLMVVLFSPGFYLSTFEIVSDFFYNE